MSVKQEKFQKNNMGREQAKGSDKQPYHVGFQHHLIHSIFRESTIISESRFRAGGPHSYAGSPNGTVAWLI